MKQAGRSILGLLLLLAAVPGPERAAEWPQWRGPGRDGVASSLEAPAEWPAGLIRRWSVAVGEGHASPVISGGIVYLHSREKDEEVVRALRLGDGSVVWRQAWSAPYEMHMAATGHGKGPKATPALAAGRLFALGIEGTLTALDAADGRVLWKRSFPAEFKTTSPLYGSAASPVVDGDRLICFVGGHHDGALMALEVATGRTLWSLKGDGPGYASPIVAELAGRRQIVTQSDRRVLGVGVDDGRLLWSLPITTPYDQNAVTALVHGGLLIVSGLEQGMTAYRIESRDGGLVPEPAWSRKDLSLYLSSPVAASGRLFGFSPARRGHLFCLDAKSGADLWHAQGSGAEHASLVLAEPWLLSLTDGAELTIGRADRPSWSPAARYTLAESPTWAHLAPVSAGLLVKDRTTLTLHGWGASAAAPPK